MCAFPLQPGSDPCNPSHDAGRVFAEAGKMVLQVPGMQEMVYGTFVEDATMLQLLVDWDSQKCHLDWRKTEPFGPFSDLIWTIIQQHNLEIFHVDFEPPNKHRTVLSAPVTEVATFFFDDAPPADYLNGAATFSQHCVEVKADGFIDLVAGITYQDLEREGVKGKAAVVMIGWRNIDDHAKFRETQVYKDHFHLLRRDATKIEVHHVAYRDIREISS
ncbi:hypothetical protein LTR06_008378 [Exophiala xenobiotica]|nr:hypothetical protein LTR06_008378 [Exophiala xenobiotica]